MRSMACCTSHPPSRATGALEPAAQIAALRMRVQICIQAGNLSRSVLQATLSCAAAVGTKAGDEAGCCVIKIQNSQLLRKLPHLMAAVRRRKAHPSGSDDRYNNSVHESLLPEQHELEERTSERHGHAQQPLIEVLLHGWTFYTQAISGVFGWILGSIGWTSLTETQIRQINALRASIRQKFDADNPAHQEELATLWRNCFPDEEWVPGPHDRWKDAGFQNRKPESDFRGGGIYSLKNLNYMAKHHNRTFQQLLWKSVGTRADLEYPFCAAGINITFQLEEMLELRTAHTTQKLQHAPSTRVGINFVEMLDQHPHAFEEVYVVAFEVLDREWLSRGASYMEFPVVLKATLTAIKTALSHRHETVPNLRQHLGLEIDEPLL
eukprot:jgi/Ulvmu1/5007/UM021_0024.1